MSSTVPERARQTLPGGRVDAQHYLHHLRHQQGKRVTIVSSNNSDVWFPLTRDQYFRIYIYGICGLHHDHH